MPIATPNIGVKCHLGGVWGGFWGWEGSTHADPGLLQSCLHPRWQPPAERFPLSRQPWPLTQTCDWRTSLRLAALWAFDAHLDSPSEILRES